jgi:hypothetical protein
MLSSCFCVRTRYAMIMQSTADKTADEIARAAGAPEGVSDVIFHCTEPGQETHCTTVKKDQSRPTGWEGAGAPKPERIPATSESAESAP